MQLFALLLLPTSSSLLSLVLAPQLLKLLLDHVHLLHIMLCHVVSSPLFKLPELTSLDILCAFTIHEHGLFKLDVV